ncbi:MAG: PAS domain S-box protein [Bacteroidales bacterium]|nr:PAS domain S-box protein [Bacteroidales bacterium]
MRLKLSFEDTLRIQGLIISLISFTSLIGWLSGILILSSFSKESIPMAPDTAFIFTIYGIILLIKPHKSSNNNYKKATAFLIMLFTIYGFLKSIEFFINIDLTFEDYLFPITEKLGLFPLKRMSPVTGFLFLMAGISFLIKFKYGEHHKTNNLISILGLLVAFFGFTVILGYLFQTPLLYKSKIIPMALSTAICFLFLGISIIFIAEQKNIITKQFVGKTPYNILIRTIIPILFTVILVQGLILSNFDNSKIINYAFLSAMLSLFLIIITSIIIIHASKIVFKNAIIAENKSKQAEATIQIKNELLKFTGELAKIGGWEYVTETHRSTFTDEVAKIFELESNREFSNEILAKFLTPNSKKDYDIALKDAIRNAFPYDLKLNIITNTGKQKCIRAIGIPISENSKIVKIRGIIHDITEENEYERQQQLLTAILSILNSPNEWDPLLSGILLKTKEFLNIDAIAIRVQEGKDFPYYKTIGFPDGFLDSEQSICSRKADGEIQYDQDNKPIFECYCGIVINDKTDPTKPYYTPYGSFWLNDSKLLNSYIPKKDLPFKFRNHCVGEYKSIALIPLRSDNEIIGLLQLNGKRENMFLYETISFLEEIGSLIGLAFKKMQARNLIRTNEKKFRTIFESAAVGVALLNLNTWKPIEINKKYCEILGYTQEELLKINFQDITYEDDKSNYPELKKLLINDEIKEYSTAKRYYHKNGSIVWVNLFVSSIPAFEDTSKYIIAVVEDISAHKVIERALRDSMEHFRSITQTAGDAIISIDQEGKIITWNNAATRIFGYPEAEAIGLFLNSLIVPDNYSNKILEGLQKVIKNDEEPVIGETLELTALTKDRELIPIELSVSSFKKGNQWHATTIIRDITERKNSEWAIHKRVKEIQCLHNITRITDKENLTIGKFINKVVNLIPSGFQCPEKTHCKVVLKDQIFQTDSFVENEPRLKTNIVNKNKQIGYIDICLSDYPHDNKRDTFLKEERGLLSTISKILSEFIERKRKEQIQKIIYNSSIAVDSSNDLVDLIDYIKNQIGLLIDTTNFFAALYDEETDSISLPYHKDQRDNITKFPAGKTLTKHVIKTQKPLLITKKQIEEFENLGVIETIGNVAAVWLGVPLIVKGKITGIFAVQSYEDEHAYDLDDLEMLEFISRQVSISIERKKVEQDLKAALSKTMESDRLKSTFLATMSHELRTPLNAVIGFSEMLQSEIQNDKVNEYASVINNSGLNLLEIIEDIFDITLLESGEVKISNSEFSLSPLMDDIRVIVELEKEKLGKQTLDVKFYPPKNLNTLTINTDRSKLKQILINILKNALKFTFEGYVEYGFSVEKVNNTIKFYIKDTGIGIRKEDTEIIFENFRQVDDSNTRLFGGTGLGLSVAKKYSDMIGGKIWVESTFGEGSTFYLTIPYIEPITKAVKNSEEQSITPKFSGKTILIAEDEASNYELLIVYLEDLEVKTLWARDGEEAVSICELNGNIDLILMDIKMPKMNGLDATSKIRKLHPNLPIIAQTAFVLHGDDEKAFEAGCNDYIGKPIRRRDLYNLLSKYLHS